MNGANKNVQKLSIEARQAIQTSNESIRVLARRYKVNPKTIAKWKRRDNSSDCPRTVSRPLILSGQQQQIIIQVQQKLNLTLDQLLFIFGQAIPQLSRSTLYRCLKRNGIELPSRGPQISAIQKAIKFKTGKPQAGRFRISQEGNSYSGQLARYRFTARDILTEFSYVEEHKRRTKVIVAGFMKGLIAATPYKISAVMTDGSHWFCSQVAKKPRHSHGLIPFEKICRNEGIEEYFEGTPSEESFLNWLDPAPVRRESSENET